MAVNLFSRRNKHALRNVIGGASIALFAWSFFFGNSSQRVDEAANRGRKVVSEEAQKQEEFVLEATLSADKPTSMERDGGATTRPSRAKDEDLEDNSDKVEKERKRHADLLLLSEFDVVGSSSPEVNDEYAKEFLEAEAKVVPGAGEDGEAVVLNEQEEELAKIAMDKVAINIIASDKISLRRRVPDPRNELCREIAYDVDLPSASVIIVFTNEEWSTLLRTVWSVLDQTPDAYLHEIVLIDDFSDKPHLRARLWHYIARRLPSKVRLKRLRRRSGLIRARLEGASLATGQVLLFLDSHCECTKDWIQPLLHRIKEEPKAFVVPVIDVIDERTLEYCRGSNDYVQLGGFRWDGHFNWIDIPDHELLRRGSAVAPTRTPTMAGGLFAVLKETFYQMGSYDQEMDLWGGENLEMSFRVWQCGGILETIPCSRVGHIFRKFHPYKFPGNKDSHGINTARTVEVWMDEYKRVFYLNRPDLLEVDIGDLSERKRFRKEQKCRSFKWYLDTIFPQKFVPIAADQVLAFGRLRNPSSSLCLDTLGEDDPSGNAFDAGLYSCNDVVSASQLFSFSSRFELRHEDSCAELAGDGNTTKVVMAPCHGLGDAQLWGHTEAGSLAHKGRNVCLFVSSDKKPRLKAGRCDASDSQIWVFDNYTRAP